MGSLSRQPLLRCFVGISHLRGCTQLCSALDDRPWLCCECAELGLSLVCQRHDGGNTESVCYSGKIPSCASFHRANVAECFDSVAMERVHCCLHTVQGCAKKWAPGVANFVPAVAYHFCLTLPAAFTQPGDLLIAEPCIEMQERCAIGKMSRKCCPLLILSQSVVPNFLYQ